MMADERQLFQLTATCPAHNNLQSHVQSKEVVDPFERKATDVLSSSASSYKKQKLRHSESTTSTAAKSKEETSELSKKNNHIDQLLKDKLYEEVDFQVAQSFGKVLKVRSIMESLVNHIKDQGGYIKELEATIERKDKDFEKWMLATKEEHVTQVRAETTGATNKESLKRSGEGYENFKKEVNEQIKGLEKIVEKLQADMRQKEEAKQSHLHTRRESSLSSPKNAEPLASQNENDIIEGAAAVTAPNIMTCSYWVDDFDLIDFDNPDHNNP